MPSCGSQNTSRPCHVSGGIVVVVLSWWCYNSISSGGVVVRFGGTWNMFLAKLLLSLM